MIHRVWYWLSKRCVLYFSRSYAGPLNRQGLQWTLDLIDEDIATYGNPYVHQLAKAGVILRNNEEEQ